MAIVWTAVVTKVTVFGDERVSYVTLTSNGGAYTAGGDVVTPASIGLDYVDYADSGVALVSGGGTAFVVNLTFTPGSNANVKIQLFGSNGAAAAPLIEFVGTPGANTVIQAEFRGA